jgi:hypothetical protein
MAFNTAGDSSIPHYATEVPVTGFGTYRDF